MNNNALLILVQSRQNFNNPKLLLSIAIPIIIANIIKQELGHTIMYTVSQKNCAFLFLLELCQISTNFNKFWSTVDRWQIGWNRMLCIHFPPNLTHVWRHYITLLNADVLNFTQHWIYYDQNAQIWCQSEEGILSRQLSWLETTARYAQVVRRRFFNVSTFNRTTPQRTEHATTSFSWSERDAKNASLSTHLCSCTRCTFRA